MVWLSPEEIRENERKYPKEKEPIREQYLDQLLGIVKKGREEAEANRLYYERKRKEDREKYPWKYNS